MPVSGGAADKLCNRYESLWAMDQMLHVIDGAADQLLLEPLDADESRGIEFTVVADRKIHYWSVKRQTTKAGGWTLALLAAKDMRGRSILADLLSHVERNSKNFAAFASTLGAYEFEELRVYANDSENFKARLNKSEKLNLAFRKYLLPVCGGDIERVLTFLQRARTHAADEMYLRDNVDFAIRKLLYSVNNSPVDVAAVKGHLAETLLDNIHSPLTKELILQTLAKCGFLLRDWSIDKSVRGRVEACCTAYVSPLKLDLINNSLLPIPGTDRILGTDGIPTHRKTLVVGEAGAGKSTILTGIVERLRLAAIPVVPVRFDQLPEGILTTTELGRKLQLPESPTVVLSGIADGAESVLIVDQLDAVSIASGRRSELWFLFDQLRQEVERSPRMSLIVGCREFDVEHDKRMRSMKAEAAGFSLVLLKPLSEAQVNEVLRSAGTDPAVVQPSLKPILTVPLYLSMFLRLSLAARTGVHNRDELFDNFWTESETRTSQRLGRSAQWTQVIDKLANWLSEHQQLSAPQHVLDEYSSDSAAMASEHALVLSEGRYRFFHESFFDYVFARRFAARGGHIVDLLLGTEQHLFRRAQVRQIFSYLRTREWPRYLKELEQVLTGAGVRFHIKRLLFQWLSSLTDPRLQEWNILRKLAESEPNLRSHVRTVITANPSWFDVLDNAGFFDAALSGDDAASEEAVWMLALPTFLEARSARVAALLRKYRKPSERWNQYLRHVCRFGSVYHSREMFDLFLSLIDDGTVEGLRPGFAVNDTWWTTLYSAADNRPDLASEVIGRWFDRTIADWESKESAVTQNAENPGVSLRALLNQGGEGAQVVHMVAKSPLSFAKEMLPRMARVIRQTAIEREDRLLSDPLWTFRSYGDDGFQVHEALLKALATCLEELARTAPEELDTLITPYRNDSHDAVAYLVLRAWTTAPQRYANQLCEYLIADDRRLKVGYGSWGGGGSAENFVSTQAVRAASSGCTAQLFTQLERTILVLRDCWEEQHPQIRGRRQLELLQALDGSRLSPDGRRRLEELQRKFPKAFTASPMRIRGGAVPSPISDEAQDKMSDEQWLRAMQKYSGSGPFRETADGVSGGEYQLAPSLQSRTKMAPQRFAALTKRMGDDLPAIYFDAIIRGIVDARNSKDTRDTITIEDAAAVLRTVHKLPLRPCGRSFTWLIQKWQNAHWPDDVLDALAWYAVHDPDPDQDSRKQETNNEQPYHSGDPYQAGINSTRGEAACAIMQVLFDSPQQFGRLEGAVLSLVQDQSVAVRSCAIGILLPILNIDVQKAISWFKDAIAGDPSILRTPYIEKFTYFAGYRDYAALKPVICALLGSNSSECVEAGARVLCVLGLTDETAGEDSRNITTGDVTMRKAAALVYSRNVADEMVGAISRTRLKPLFADQDDSVRTQAAAAFADIQKLSTDEQGDLLRSLLDAGPGKMALVPVVRALVNSPVQLPDLVCKLARLCVDAYKVEAGDMATTGPIIATDVAKIVVRLYAQTEDPAIQSECLNLIDEMERHYFFGLSDELRKVDR